MAGIAHLVDELERSYRELQERMSDPAVYNDHREAADVGRRLKELETPHRLAQEWLAAQEDLSAARQLVKDLSDTDPAIRFYAIGALKRLTGDDFGYVFYQEWPQRQLAVQRKRHFQHAARTVFHAHTDLVDGFLAHMPFDRIAGKTTANRAQNGGRRAAAAMAHLVAQHGAQHPTRHGAYAWAGRFAGTLHRRDRLNRAAHRTHRCCRHDRCRGRIRRRCNAGVAGF